MSRPDPVRIRRNAAVVFDAAGEVVLLRAYASASAGNPRFGLGDLLTYQTLTITGLFSTLEPHESDQPGGQTQAAQFGITTDRAVGPQDEVVWNGTAYRLDGNASPAQIGGRVLWRSPLRMAGATG